MKIMKGLRLAAAVAFLSGIAAAYAAERTIGQKGKVFSEKEVAIKKGDTLVFLNDDNIAHNVMSTSAHSKFNLGLIQPGHSTPVTFKNAGEVQVMCAIHPTMKMMVKVAD
jgi:plastocyanin